MDKDAKGTLKSLGEYGYKTIESFQGEKGVFWGMARLNSKVICPTMECDVCQRIVTQITPWTPKNWTSSKN